MGKYFFFLKGNDCNCNVNNRCTLRKNVKLNSFLLVRSILKYLKISVVHNIAFNEIQFCIDLNFIFLFYFSHTRKPGNSTQKRFTTKVSQ